MDFKPAQQAGGVQFNWRLHILRFNSQHVAPCLQMRRDLVAARMLPIAV